MCKITAFGGVKRVKKGRSTCGKGGRPRGGAKVELVVCRRCEVAGLWATVSTKYTKDFVGGKHIRFDRIVEDISVQTPAR